MVKLTGKCTTCKKKYELTPDQERAASAFGCAFSPCCNAVATIERVQLTRTDKRQKRVS